MCMISSGSCKASTGVQKPVRMLNASHLWPVFAAGVNSCWIRVAGSVLSSWEVDIGLLPPLGAAALLTGVCGRLAVTFKQQAGSQM